LPDRQSGFVSLEDDMNNGAGMLLCGLLVEAQASSVITADVKDPKFYAAIFGEDDSAAPDMTTEEQHQAAVYHPGRRHGNRSLVVGQAAGCWSTFCRRLTEWSIGYCEGQELCGPPSITRRAG
jgi:tRNA(Leu) C34 or U34 (ribose-2'-O)-methylase TrmL